MSSAKLDYQQFLKWLQKPNINISSDTRRLANIIDNNFDQIYGTSRNQSQRSVLIASLVRSQLEKTSDQLPSNINIEKSSDIPWRRLSSLKIGPFRGFRTPENFEFPKQVTMFYGPNGSGKTSLCEALELALLGSVDEASAKRLPPNRYFENLHENGFDQPILKGLNNNDEIVEITPDSEKFRFCFIEKNRIDNFSRIASKTPGERKNLIASLFGMEQFHSFVNNFNELIDAQLFLNETKKQTLSEKRASQQHDRDLIKEKDNKINEIEAEEENYARSFNENFTYQQLIEHVGTDSSPGRLQKLNSDLESPIPVIYGLSKQALLDSYSNADKQEKNLKEIKKLLEAKAGETSFQSLYMAILDIESHSPDHCPACGTSINGESCVKHNPYSNAREELNKLKELGLLQEKISHIKNNWDQASRNLAAMLSDIAQRLGASKESEDKRLRYLASFEVTHDSPWWSKAYEKEDGAESMARQIVLMVAACENCDKKTQSTLENRKVMQKERENLLAAQNQINIFKTKRQDLSERLLIAEKNILNFEEVNSELIKQAEEEEKNIIFEKRIKFAYDEFLKFIKQFRLELPGTLISGLNNIALDIYNEFNRRDNDGDKLSSLYLPTNENDRITISFRSSPENKVDALHVLSEGHVRCLGVAILLAKSLQEKSPLIIFDDAINAIDTEHREGIRETIFQSERFKDTQIIVTCHSSEFIKDLQNHINKDNWTSYYFMPHNGNYHPRVKGNEITFNYIIQARSYLDIGDWRNALASSRQALEMITEKIWKWMVKNDVGVISIQLAGKRAEPSLRNLCESLKKKLIESRTFIHPDKDSVINGLESVLGIPKPSNVWTYLNKGTHEESNRDDYDSSLVTSIVENLESLNKLALKSISAQQSAAAQKAVSAV